jgi:hypothetical protein
MLSRHAGVLAEFETNLGRERQLSPKRRGAPAMVHELKVSNVNRMRVASDGQGVASLPSMQRLPACVVFAEHRERVRCGVSLAGNDWQGGSLSVQRFQGPVDRVGDLRVDVGPPRHRGCRRLLSCGLHVGANAGRSHRVPGEFHDHAVRHRGPAVATKSRA